MIFNSFEPLFLLLYLFFLCFKSLLKVSHFGSCELKRLSEIRNCKKSGAFMPGVRPGAATRKYLEFVVNRITLIGATFLGTIAILPSLVQNLTGIQSLAIGGTSALIVVSVILETAKQVESMLVEQNYDQYR